MFWLKSQTLRFFSFAIRQSESLFKIVILRSFEWLIETTTPDGKTKFYPTEKFSWALDVESRWREIRRELDELIKHKEKIPNFQIVSPLQYFLTKDDDWKVYFFYMYGYRVEKNCQACPKTAQVLKMIPNMKTAFFSILGPKKHLREHRGPYKGVLRYHLGLKIPEPKESCKIRIGKESAHWEEGKSLIFDDSFPHEVWNNADSHRIILFVDFLRPLPFPWSALNRIIIKLFSLSSYIQTMRKNQKIWDDQTLDGSQGC